MPQGYRSDGKKMGFQKGHKINNGRKWTDEQKSHIDRYGNKNPKWRGGRILTIEGYLQVYSPYHPYRTKDNYVLEHRLVMERHIKRFLTRKEVVHHKNSIPYDNRLKNLVLFATSSEHVKHHYLLREKSTAPLRSTNKKGVNNGTTC